MDLATLTAAPTTVTVGGRDFKIGPLRFLELGILQRWLNEHTSRPADAPAGWKPPQVMLDHAWLGEMLADEDGLVAFLQVLFGKHQELADGDLEHILAQLGPAHLGPLIKVALDLPDREPDAPKAEAAP